MWTRLGAVVALAWCGCIESQLVVCDDGRACPIGLACDLVHHSCVTPDQLTACNGVADRTECATAEIPSGACFDGVCLPVGCGNLRVDPGEACDDGNLVPGDGCRPDCLSDETCGNGMPDFGEVCDDGNRMSHDACDSQCARESPTWTKVMQVPDPVLEGFAYAHDVDRDRIVLSGGFRQTSGSVDSFNDATHEWDGAGWLLPDQIVVPPTRSGGTMAYDRARGTTILFGGEGRADTWLLRSGRWTEYVGPAPPPRTRAAMVYDENRQVVLLVGGRDASDVQISDMWQWDGAWTELTPPTMIPARSEHAMAYDRKRGTVIVYGGFAQTWFNDTWSWDGTTWTDVSSTPNPGDRQGAMMVFDDATQQIVHVGGGLITDPFVWLWDGAWTSAGSNSAADRQYGGLVDQPGPGVLVFGGSSIATTIDRVRVIDGANFTPHPGALPPSFQPGVVAYDSLRSRHVMFGGKPTATTFHNETWELVEEAWKRRIPATSPPTVPIDGGTAIAFDERRGVTVMFSVGDEVWEWDGTNWTHVPAPSLVPIARVDHAAVYDPVRGVTMMYGGRSPLDPTGGYPETWTWDGATWVNVSTTPAPPATVVKLAYDAKRQRVVAMAPNVRQIWEWDGTWHDVTPPPPAVVPDVLYTAAVDYDSRRGEVIVHGQRGTAPTTELWSWNGTRWLRLFANSGPSSAIMHQARYDGDQLVEVTTNGTYVLSWRSTDGEDESCRATVDQDGDQLSGCADPDCWSACSPQCPPMTTCNPAAPHCGDGACGPTETCGNCPGDCGC